MPNHLQFETSPYLLQHAGNPVDWYPWGEEAFQKARAEDKPVFLSIGYSTCHWCHVMARESFEDEEAARLLNQYFVSIKVDREERPDIDSVYMAFCQAFTGSGGWPASIFMTASQEPFYAGTYFPTHSRGGMVGLVELLEAIHEKWRQDRPALLRQAREAAAHVSRPSPAAYHGEEDLAGAAAALYKQTYDRVNGGFGPAPKFPMPHTLLFLLAYAQRRGDPACRDMAEHTLRQMYRGGLFDHIGFGFCRYSTDEKFLAPHFEKMLYDNALLILAYCKAYEVTRNAFYLETARKTAAFVLGEMALPGGGFASAFDADSEGEEGKFYLFTPGELEKLLGREAGGAFCRRYGITEKGNFQGKSIPNLLRGSGEDSSLDGCRERVREYRSRRCPLHRDDKALTAWNALMAAALCRLYRASGDAAYLDAAKRADAFIQKELCQGGQVFVSCREGKRGAKGFLDDYAYLIFAQLELYGAALEPSYLERARQLCGRAIEEFQDKAGGGFYLYGNGGERLVLRPKETYDGALPSGNSMMAWDLVRLAQLTENGMYGEEARRQLDFLSREAAGYPAGYAVFLLALLDQRDPPPKVTVVLAGGEGAGSIPLELPPEAAVKVLRGPAEGYPLLRGETTFYVCRGHQCLPPSNSLEGLL